MGNSSMVPVLLSIRYRQTPQTEFSGGALRPCGKVFSPGKPSCYPLVVWATSQEERRAHHERTAASTSHGDPWAKCVGHHHGAGRRCGAPHWADGHDGLPGGLGPAYPSPLDTTGDQLGVDGGHLAGLYPHGRRPPESVGGSLSQGHAPHAEPPD